MRLTLRTLLAYRDGVLSRGDHEDLHRRIQQSPDAGNLLRRIEELTGNSNVLTPKLESTGLADTNIIAEYLDDVLTTTRIAELERLFLEYNEHLCELAHCHRMLAEAMRTQIDVPEGLHHTALQIVQPSKRAEIKAQLLTQSRKLSKTLLVADVVESSSTNPSSPTLSSPSPKGELQSKLHAVPINPSSGPTQQAGLNLEGASLTHEVPEYLLGARKLRWKIPAAMVGLAAAFLVLIWQSIGSVDNLRTLMFAKADGDLVATSKDDSESTDGGEKAVEENSTSNTLSDTAAKSPATDADAKEQDVLPSSLPTDSGQADRLPSESNSTELAGENAKAVEASASTAATTTAESTKSDSVNSVRPTDSTDAIPLSWVWRPTDNAERQSVVLNQSGGNISLVNESAPPIQEGTLVLPPVGRTSFEVGAWRWQAVGPSVVNIECKDSKLTVTTALCRTLLSAAAAGQRLTLNTPAGSFELELVDKAAWLGIEVNYRAVARGSVIEPNTYAPTVVIVVGTDGVPTEDNLFVLQSKADKQVHKIETAGRGIAIVKPGQAETFVLQSPPAWYRRRSIRAIDQLGMADFHAALSTSTEPLTDRLHTLAADPRPEVAALAIQTGLLLGHWQPWANELLHDDRMRSHWINGISLARQLLAAQPDTHKNVQAALQSKFGTDSDEILNLLLGLPQAQQNADGLLSLLKGLDADASLPVRVLTAFELKHLTGEENSYQPHAPMRASLQQWRLKVSSGKATLLPVNDPISERYPR